MKILHVISMSGGKDSTATALLALERHPRDSLRFVFADTGNEHEAVYEYLAYLEQALGIEIVRLRADFTRQIEGKRRFIEASEPGGNREPWGDEAKASALEHLHPTGNPFLDLCMWKGRFPSRRAQFCTQELKTKPLTKYQLALVDEGYTVVSWQGVRRDESINRRDVLAIEELADDMWAYRPIADWTAEDTFAMHRKYGIEPNPLYKQSMGRVGCMPCINARKAEINEISKRFPEHIQRIAEWEKKVTLCSKRQAASFFSNRDRDPIDKPTIWAVVEWSKTARGGVGLGAGDLFEDDEELPACASAYGLCE